MDVLTERLLNANKAPLPPKPPLKTFKPAFPEIPRLKDYRAEQNKQFWGKFPRNRNTRGGSPYKINTEVLTELVVEAGSPFALTLLLEVVIPDILQGADLKVGSDYIPQRAKNAHSAYEEGYCVTNKKEAGRKSSPDP